jgi:CubicO group peptidase (beta-lactamase class C family)
MGWKLGVALAAVGLVLACAPAPPPAADPLVDYLDQAVRTERFRGAVEVRRGGEILLRQGFDQSDMTTGKRNGPDTRFRIASMTKQFTGLAVLMLQEQGKLRVTDPVCDHLPSCPPQWRSITIDQLLTHTAGLYNYTDSLLENRAEFYTAIGSEHPTPAQLVTSFADRPLEFQPGSRTKYSNSGYVLLGYLIEHVSGHSYGDFLRREIFDPLGMSDTGYEPGPKPDMRYATGYEDWTTPSPVFDDAVWFAAGGLYSSVTDLSLWQQFLLTGIPSITKPGTLAELLRPRVAMAPTQWYGYGIAIHGTPASVQYYHHSGGIPGFSSYGEIHPDTGISVTVLSNVDIGVDQFGRTLASLVPQQD